MRTTSRMKKFTLCMAACMILGLGLSGSSYACTKNTKNISADDAITAVTTIAFVDIDGPKVQAIVVKYNDTLLKGSVSTATYNAYSYANLPIVYEDGAANGGTVTAAEGGTESMYPAFELETGTPGAITYAYVRSTPTIDPKHVGDKSGNYVIIELNTDYMLASAIADWRSGVAGGVEQLVSITAADNKIITPNTAVKSNYVDAYYYNMAPMGSGADQVDHSYWGDMVFDDSLYTLSDIAGYKLHTSNVTPASTQTYTNQVTGATITAQLPDETVLSRVVGPSFTGTHCFSEYDGNYYNPSLMYAIYVPPDYDRHKKYMLVLHIPDAGGLGDDPVIALTESQAPSNYASAWVQQLAKNQGYGGIIIVVPEILNADQDVDNSEDANEFVPATWQLIDEITSEYPNIDRNRIYGSGQSMGGMQILDMASQRSDYFAGIWARGSQWGSNYNKSYTAPFDGKLITNPNWQNWYYSVSDLNILATNMTGDGSSTGGWQMVDTVLKEFDNGYQIPYTIWDPTTTTQAEENASLEALLAEPNALGMWWDALSGGSHKLTWMFADSITDSYNWLLSQTRQSEVARGKLEVLKGSYSAGLGTDGFNSVCGGSGGGPGGGGPGGGPGGGGSSSGCAATAGITASPTSLSVAAGSSATLVLTFNTATTDILHVSYTVSVVDANGNNASSDLTITYEGRDGSWRNISELTRSSDHKIANGKALTLSVEGNVVGTYTVTFTATYGSTTISTTVPVTVTAS